MPWKCGFCNEWRLSTEDHCSGCGRSGRGRLCAKCKIPAREGATHCVSCGGAKFIESAIIKLPVRASTQLGIAAFVIGSGGVALWLLQPLLVLVANLALTALMHVASWLVTFWVATAILPDGPRQTVRRVAAGICRVLATIIGNLVR